MLSACASFLFISLSTTGIEAKEPRVPPGLHPGGPTVTIVSTDGTDYRKPNIADRLARDGEGDLIGWDFVDSDMRPFGTAKSSKQQLSATGVAELVLREATGSSLIPIKTGEYPSAPAAQTLSFVGQMPTRIVLYLDVGNYKAAWSNFAKAASHVPHLMLIVPASPSSQSSRARAGLADNVLAVAGAKNGIGADVAVDVGERHGDVSKQQIAVIAAAKVAALAARLLAAEPDLKGAILKRRIVGLGKLPADKNAIPVIHDISHQFKGN